MSQIEILLILQELGGSAKQSDIMKRAREKFPDLSLHKYVGNRLQKLSKSGCVSCKRDDTIKQHIGDVVWTIIDDSVLQNRNIIQL